MAQEGGKLCVLGCWSVACCVSFSFVRCICAKRNDVIAADLDDHVAVPKYASITRAHASRFPWTCRLSPNRLHVFCLVLAVASIRLLYDRPTSSFLQMLDSGGSTIRIWFVRSISRSRTYVRETPCAQPCSSAAAASTGSRARRLHRLRRDDASGA